MSDEAHKDSPSPVVDNDVPSCDPTLTRAEFLKRVTETAVNAGTVVLGVKILDKFLVPPAYAAWSQTYNRMTKVGTGG